MFVIVSALDSLPPAEADLPIPRRSFYKTTVTAFSMLLNVCFCQKSMKKTEKTLFISLYFSFNAFSMLWYGIWPHVQVDPDDGGGGHVHLSSLPHRLLCCVP
jgi:hypothetical protein